MRNRFSTSDLVHVAAIAALMVVITVSCAAAHVILAPSTATPGAMIDADFKVGHGCSGQATTGLQVEIPAGVTDIEPYDKAGWALKTETHKDGTIVSWSGGTSAPDKPESFTIMMTLPKTAGKLVFPATQTCGGVEEHWSETGAPPLKRPAPVLTLAASTATVSVTVSDAWIRALPGTLPSGGYFTLRNTGDKPLTLTGAQSPACGMLMLHKSENHGGMNGMSDVTQVQVGAGGEVKFLPGGYHLMCMDAKALKPGASVPVTLQFADGAQVTAPFAVKTATGK
jgi:copper(I)-binding protein